MPLNGDQSVPCGSSVNSDSQIGTSGSCSQKPTTGWSPSFSPSFAGTEPRRRHDRPSQRSPTAQYSECKKPAEPLCPTRWYGELSCSVSLSLFPFLLWQQTLPISLAFTGIAFIRPSLWQPGCCLSAEIHGSAGSPSVLASDWQVLPSTTLVLSWYNFYFSFFDTVIVSFINETVLLFCPVGQPLGLHLFFLRFVLHTGLS